MLEFGRGQPLAGGLIAYGALAWLGAGAFARGAGGGALKVGAGLQLLAGAAWIAGVLYLATRFGAAGAAGWSLLAAVGIGGAALAAIGLAAGRMAGLAPWRALAAVCALGLVAHGVVLAGVGPRLSALWVSQRLAAALGRAGLDPRSGVTPGPVAVCGYGEPSLTFLLGGLTEVVPANEAADAIGEGRPAVIEARQEAAFLAALQAGRRQARMVGEVDGFNYAKTAPVALKIYAARP
jgi:hypothetical protein